MPHLESTIKTQRIMCIKKYTENYYSPWKLILSHHLKNYGDKFLLHCNYDVADLPKSLPKFYRECFGTWATVTAMQPSSRDDIMDQILWNNKHLRIDDKPRFCKKLLMTGITRIKDILLPNGKLKPWNFFKEKGLNLNNYFLILGLSKSLPASWSALLTSDSTSHSLNPDSFLNDFTEYIFHSKTGDINLIQLTSKKLYWILVDDIRIPPTARLKYSSIYDDQDLNWKQIYLIPHKVTLDIKTRMFQYKLLNRIVYTNKLLHKIKLSDTPLCTFCGEYDESLEHLFLHCQFSKHFWTQIISWLNEFNLTITELKDSEIMLGYTNDSPHWTLLNHILIIAKQVIYSSQQ